MRCWAPIWRIRTAAADTVRAMRSPIPLTAGVAIVLAFAGCGSSSDDTVSKEDVQKQAQAKFDEIAQKQGAKTFPKITCPDDLDAEKGKTVRCSATGADGTLGITVTVTSVEDGKVNLNFKGDDKLSK